MLGCSLFLEICFHPIFFGMANLFNLHRCQQVDGAMGIILNPQLLSREGLVEIWERIWAEKVFDFIGFVWKQNKSLSISVKLMVVDGLVYVCAGGGCYPYGWSTVSNCVLKHPAPRSVKDACSNSKSGWQLEGAIWFTMHSFRLCSAACRTLDRYIDHCRPQNFSFIPSELFF